MTIKSENNRKVTSIKATPIIVMAILAFTILLPYSHAATPNALTDDQIDQLFQRYAPSSLSSEKETMLKQKILDHPEVKSLINSKQYRIEKEYGFIGNLLQKPGEWNPVFNISLDEEQISIAVEVDDKTDEVVKIESINYAILDTNGEASDYYTGSSTIDGIHATFNSPSYTHSAGTYTAFVINALRSGSNEANVCVASAAPSTYWFQIGYLFNSEGPKIVWTDTKKSCVAQATTFSYNAGDQYRFRITSGGNGFWTGYSFNLTTGNTWSVGTFTSSTGPQNFATSTHATSVFFENDNASAATTWDTGFGSNPTATTAQYRSQGSSTWSNWQAEQKQAICGGTSNPNDVMSGSFLSGGTVTWNKLKLRQLCDAF